MKVPWPSGGPHIHRIEPLSEPIEFVPMKVFICTAKEYIQPKERPLIAKETSGVRLTQRIEALSKPAGNYILSCCFYAGPDCLMNQLQISLLTQITAALSQFKIFVFFVTF